MTQYDANLTQIYGKETEALSEKDLDDLADVEETKGLFADCPDCMGECELAGGLESCDCVFCGTKK